MTETKPKARRPHVIHEVRGVSFLHDFSGVIPVTWIRVHSHLVGRPVVARCAAACGIDHYKAAGHLVTLWGAVSLHAENGQVVAVPDVLLEQWAGWTGKRGRFAAWLRADHMDADGRIREWDEYQGALELRREKERDRKRTSRGQSAGRHADRGRDVRNLLQPYDDGTERNGTEQTTSSSARGLFLESIPTAKRTGWLATLAGWEQGQGTPGGKAYGPDQIDAGLAEYLATETAPTFAPRHVVRFVEQAIRGESSNGQRPPRRVASFLDFVDPPTETPNEAAR